VSNPSPDQLHKVLVYDESTGDLYWRERPASDFPSWTSYRSHRNKSANRKAGAIKRRKDGRVKSIVVRVNNVLYPAHCLIWIMRRGEIPDGLQVDHRNRNPLDNRLENLRLATHSQNQQNSAHRGNSTGFKCVVPRGERFVAKLKHAGKQIHIGTFDTPVEANAAYFQRAKQLYGDFAHA